MQELTGFQRDCLYVIAGLSEPRGVDIKEELGAYYYTEIRKNRLYTNLDELVDVGLIAKAPAEWRNNRYELTDEGLQVLDDRRKWEGELPDG